MSPHHHRINFAPEEWGQTSEDDPRRSVLATAALSVLLLVIGLSIGSAEPAEASPRVSTDTAMREPSRHHVATDDPTASSLWRAARWHPWHVVLARMAERLQDDSRLIEVSYASSQKELKVSGEFGDFAQLPTFMLAFDEFRWLTDVDPYKVERNEQTNAIAFTLRLRVLPLIAVEEIAE